MVWLLHYTMFTPYNFSAENFQIDAKLLQTFNVAKFLALLGLFWGESAKKRVKMSKNGAKVSPHNA